jgi:hypothetical protein
MVRHAHDSTGRPRRRPRAAGGRATWLTGKGVPLLLAVLFGLLAWRRLVMMGPLQRR